jgi:hypothetical protein
LCAGYGNGEGRLAPVYARRLAHVVFAVNLNSPNRFICRGSGGFDRGPVIVPGHRAAKCLLRFAVNINTKSIFL